jgi:hypothetical protein
MDMRGILLLLRLQGSTPWDQKAGFLQYYEFGISTAVVPVMNRNIHSSSTCNEPEFE